MATDELPGKALEIAGAQGRGESYEVTLVTPYGTRTIRARGTEHIWDEAKLAGVNLPAICHQGRCLTCAGQLLDCPKPPIGNFQKGAPEKVLSESDRAEKACDEGGNSENGNFETCAFDSGDAVSYFPQDREAGFILLCTAKARSNLRIRTHRQTEMRAHRKKLGLPAPYA